MTAMSSVHPGQTAGSTPAPEPARRREDTTPPTTGRPISRLVVAYGVFGPPLAWALTLLLDYYFSSLSCSSDFTRFRWFHASGFLGLALLITGLLALVCVGAGVASWRAWRRTGAGVMATIAGVDGWRPFAALAGILLSGYFLLIIVLTGIPNLTTGCAL
jgi:hypothetical protein